MTHLYFEEIKLVKLGIGFWNLSGGDKVVRLTLS